MKYKGLIWHILWDRGEASRYYEENGTYRNLPRVLEQSVTFWTAMGRGYSPLQSMWMALFGKGWVIRD